MENKTLNKQEIIDYIYYEEGGKLIAKLNVENLKEYLNVDEIILEEI